jgi:hypothetical protein
MWSGRCCGRRISDIDGSARQQSGFRDASEFIGPIPQSPPCAVFSFLSPCTSSTIPLKLKHQNLSIKVFSLFLTILKVSKACGDAIAVCAKMIRRLDSGVPLTVIPTSSYCCSQPASDFGIRSKTSRKPNARLKDSNFFCIAHCPVRPWCVFLHSVNHT